jgi:uncharacterized membrane protein (DUF2068 family)
MIEAAKGVLAVAIGLAFVEIVRHDVDLEDAALNLLYLLHIDPERRIALALLHAAERMNEANVMTVISLVGLYAGLRFLESYGLWRQRIWAEWLAIISGAIYLPFEVRALVRHPTAVHWAVLLINIVIVLYIAYVRWEDIQQRRHRGNAPGARLVEHGD